MPSFDTPEPIDVEIDLLVASVTVTAEDRDTTEVTVAPADPGNESDVEAAEQTKVALSKGTLTVKGPAFHKYMGWKNKSRAVTLAIALPSGSGLSGFGIGSVASLDATGRLGACEIRSGMGNVRIERADRLKLNAGGDILVDQVDGDAHLTTSMGKLRLGRAAGSVKLKNSQGPCTVDEVGGNARVRTSMGDIAIGRVDGDVDAASAQGTVRVEEMTRGTAELKTSLGSIDVGVGEGTAAWLDVHAAAGAVNSHLENSGEPGPEDPVVSVKARTSYGDITIRRTEHQ
ncbi:DUF4097 family beta strand repeat-containing protein [Salininema proteolyticum]|uniref:DUF4097 domain-containing protein n=1 Tax=Salininema proteolyticum TaxID=1607685 RepID=A0ABV8U4N0_9ACTN